MSCSIESSLTLEDLYNVKKFGELKYIDKLCIDKQTYDYAKYINQDIDKICHHKFPNNGEFEAKFDTTSLNCKTVDNFKTESCFDPKYLRNITKNNGYKCSYKRIDYKANPEKCCLSDKDVKIIDGLTCNPRFRGFTESCKNINKKYCSVGDRIFKDQHCINWCKHQDLGKKTRLDLCNNKDFFNKNRTDCMRICAEEKGQCDEVMKNSCINEKNTLNEDEMKYCSCINYVPITPFSPAVCDNICNNNGYKTAVMNTDINCPLTVCNIEIGKSSDDNLNFGNNTILNKCNSLDPNKPISVLNNPEKISEIDTRIRNLKIMIPLMVFISILILVFVTLLYFL